MIASTMRFAGRASLAITLAALAFAAPHVSAAGTSFTLDSILAAPFVDNLAGSPERDALVWTVHERGAHNVVVWQGGVAVELTHSHEDDGQALSAVHFVPDATAVVYTRGGDGDSGSARATRGSLDVGCDRNDDRAR